MTHTTSDEAYRGIVLLRENHRPSPKLSRKQWGLLLGGSLLLTGGIWGILHITRVSDAPAAVSVPAIAVKTLEIRAQAIANTLELSGTIRPLEQATLSTRVMGRITQLALESGDRFRKGAVLAQIDVTDISAQTDQARSGVVQAQAGVVQAQAELSRSQATLSQLDAQKIEAQAALQLAKIDQGRMASLRAEGAVSQERLDQANTALAQAQAKVVQVEAGVRQAKAAIGQAGAAVEQSQSSVHQAESGVASASISESYGTVVAPFDGVVVQKLAYEGEMAAPGTALLKVENPDRLQLEIAVPEENVRFVRVGQPVKVRVDAVNQTLPATIQQIVPASDPTSRSFLVKISLKNSGRLISGMFGRIVLPLDEKQETILIPTAALIQRGQLQGVYGIETNSSNQSTAALRWVKTGKSQNDQIEIVSGLMAGDRIITSNISQLSDGQPIALRE